MTTDAVQPRISPDVAFHDMGDRGLLLQHNRWRTQLLVDPPLQGAARAMDGSKSLEELESLLLGSRGGFAYRDLALLLYRLWDRGLLENEEAVRQALFPHHEKRLLDKAQTWKAARTLLSAAWINSSLAMPLARTAAAGRLLSSPLSLIAMGLATTLALVIFATGTTEWPHNLFKVGDSWAFGLVASYVTASLLLSFRGLIRASILAGPGMGLQRAGFRLSCGIFYFDVDDRQTFHLSRNLQIRLGVAGLLGPGAVGGLLLCEQVLMNNPGSASAHIAALALLIVFLQLCPFLATDGARLVEQLADLPRQRFRVRKFIAEELFRGVISGSRTEASWRFSLVATLWFVWFFAAFHLFLSQVLSQFVAILAEWARSDSLAVQIVCGIVLLYALVVALVLVGTSVVVVLRLLKQVAQPRKTDAPQAKAAASALSDKEQEELIGAIRRLALAGALSDQSLTEVMTGVDKLQFEAGAWIGRAGPSDRFYWVLGGRVELLRPLPEGGHQFVASIGPGENFGEAALTSQDSTFDVRATEPSSLIALDTATFTQAIGEGEGEGPAAEIRSTLDRARVLSRIPELAALGPTGCLDLATQVIERSASSGELVLKQGEISDAMFLVAKGEVKVSRHDENGNEETVALLSEGSTFGEMGILLSQPRSASVSCTKDSVLIEVPRAVLEGLLRRSFHIGLALESLATERLEGLQ